VSRVDLAGKDDLCWLDRRNTHPQPGSAAPSGAPPKYSVTAYDVDVAAASSVIWHYVNVNAGPGAVPARQVPGWVMAADPMVGPVLAYGARWQKLLTIAQYAAAPDLGFRAPGLVFQVYEPADRTATVRFSLELGNLVGYKYVSDAPGANFVVVAGAGEGVDRIIREGSDSASIAEWGRIEEFVDRRDSDDLTDLDQTVIKELGDKASPVGLSLSPLDTDQMKFGVHWELGDKVTAVIDGVAIRDRVREVRFTIDEQGEQIVPSIGDPDAVASVAPRLFSSLRNVEQRTKALEVR